MFLDTCIESLAIQPCQEPGKVRAESAYLLLLSFVEEVPFRIKGLVSAGQGKLVGQHDAAHTAEDLPDMLETARSAESGWGGTHQGDRLVVEGDTGSIVTVWPRYPVDRVLQDACYGHVVLG